MADEGRTIGTSLAAYVDVVGRAEDGLPCVIRPEDAPKLLAWYGAAVGGRLLPKFDSVMGHPVSLKIEIAL
jgi:hypothetical protein